MCSQCSCDCEKEYDEQSICLCSRCSCQCLKDPLESIENLSQEDEVNQIISQVEEAPVIPIDRPSIISKTPENETMICECFLNQLDQWTKQFDLFPWTEVKDPRRIFNSLELDDPIVFRQMLFDRRSI